MSNTAVVVLNGPNLNRLGKRQPDVYGTTTLADVEATLRKRAEDYGIDLDFTPVGSPTPLLPCGMRWRRLPMAQGSLRCTFPTCTPVKSFGTIAISRPLQLV